MQNLLFGTACALVSLGAVIAWILGDKPRREQPSVGNIVGALIIVAGTGCLAAGALS